MKRRAGNNIKVMNTNKFGNVRLYRKNINKNNVYASYKNQGNNLHARIMYTNEEHKGKKYQQNFLRRAINAARNAGYKTMSGISVYLIPQNYEGGNMPPSSFIFEKFGFIKQPPNRPGNNKKSPYQKIKWLLTF